MKIKSALVLFVLTVFALTGCSKGENGKIGKAADLQGKVIGMVSLPVPPKMTEMSISNALGGQPGDVKYYNRFSDCVAAVLTGKIDAAFGAKFRCEYYLKKQTGLKMVLRIQPMKLDIVMAVRHEDEQLKNDLDKALAILQGNGTLQRLEDEWVTNLSATNEPASREIPVIAGAKTVHVGVCGDYLPLDYIAANGKPAGYNVALMTEMGKLLNINFVFVPIESQAKYVALNSKKIDLIFCNLVSDTPGLQALRNHSWVATRPYYTSEAGSFLVRK